MLAVQRQRGSTHCSSHLPWRLRWSGRGPPVGGSGGRAQLAVVLLRPGRRGRHGSRVELARTSKLGGEGQKPRGSARRAPATVAELKVAHALVCAGHLVFSRDLLFIDVLYGIKFVK